MKYNGHRSWNAWNVSLWISNDEWLYHRAVQLKQDYGLIGGARRLSRELPATTPDGAKYNITCIKEAMSDL